jgi:hypothetical protein
MTEPDPCSPSRSPRSTWRSPTGAPARCGSPTRARRPASLRHHRSAVGVRSHHLRRGVQGPGAQPAVVVVVPAHHRHRRQPRDLHAGSEPAHRPRRHAAHGRSGRARLHHRGHRHRALDPLRGRRAHHLRPPLRRRTGEEHAAARADRDTHHQGRRRWTRRAAVVGRRGGRRSRRRRPVATRRERGDRTLPPRHRSRPACRADPRRHQVRVRCGRRRRTAADRRSAHARLVAVVGGRHLRRARRRPATNRRASTRRSCDVRSPPPATPAADRSPNSTTSRGTRSGRPRRRGTSTPSNV